MCDCQILPLLAHLPPDERTRICRAIGAVAAEIGKILVGNVPSFYLCGSLVLGDLRAELSDIDLLVLTQQPITDEQAHRLVGLRQQLTERDAANPWYRKLEGGMLSLQAFCSGEADTVVYWGTSGERVTDRYRFDSFSRKILLEQGLLLLGQDVRKAIAAPSKDELAADIRAHYHAICTHAQTTKRSIYAFGWLMDIARGLYTLETGEVTSKTQAARWALERGLCPVAGKLAAALIVRRNARMFAESIALGDMAENLGADVQRFAKALGDVLNTV